MKIRRQKMQSLLASAFALASICVQHSASADQKETEQQVVRKNFASDILNLHRDPLLSRTSAIIDLGAEKNADSVNEIARKKAKEEKAAAEAKAKEEAKAKADAPVFVSSDPTSHIVPPDQTPKVRINPEAPGPFIAMAEANQAGDTKTASAYADQFVRYMVNLMYEVRQLSQLQGEAMVREGLIKEDDWVGAGQYMNIEMARERRKNDSTVKATSDLSLKRVKADPQNRAEIYVFCTLTSHWCRDMGPDIERLYQATKNDPRVKMTGLLIGDTPVDLVKSYREYTGLTLPFYNGTEAARQMRIGFVPAVVVLSPNTKNSYLRTGRLNFARLYQFVRTVQGLPTEFTSALKFLAQKPIGEFEQELALKSGAQLAGGKVIPVSMPTKNDYSDEKLERF